MKLIVAAIAAFFASSAFAENYMVMEYNENVRIVLSHTQCTKNTWRAAAQKKNGEFLRGCWSPEPHEKLVRIQWEGGDFSVFDRDRFKPVSE